MIRKHASLIIAISLVALVATACIVRTSRPPAHGQRAHPVHVEKHKKVKHKKHKHKHKKHR
jgi:ABC-type nickel/cobalt efflux system permease component RcnA